MSKILKNMAGKEREETEDEITNYLINEIEEIVAKKVDKYNRRGYVGGTTPSKRYKVTEETSTHHYPNWQEKVEHFRGKKPIYIAEDKYSERKRLMLEATEKEADYNNYVSTPSFKKPLRVSNYIEEYENSHLLPFDDEEIRPVIVDKQQIKSVIKQTLRPALNNWLDENLDDIIDKALLRRESYQPQPIKKRPKNYDYD